MRTHVALLRGINVGGRNKVPMAELRTLVGDLGHADVATYIASGNVVFTSPAQDTAGMAAQLRAAIADSLGVSPAVIVLDRQRYAQILDDNPFPDPGDLRHVHIVFQSDHLTAEQIDAVDVAARQATADGSRDEVVTVGATLYLHTPDGFGRSRLAELLNRGPALKDGTARNLRTAARLRAMLDD